MLNQKQNESTKSLKYRFRALATNLNAFKCKQIFFYY
ncbi:hypothetical protein BpHYR1_023664 [Brachionus plicatilis]|uniref:Uncharacterized protein n=1 Tax=Brachionus plicatilis TaxID=10195 RepID=A0A3M7P6U7_BRAPC|nr:hypothetical protein BpHYR1_023664 [Brachionus plicatilis]